MSLFLRHMMKAIRADVSAILLIAFVFQLLTPVIVLASDNLSDSEFEASLRQSICRVDIGSAQTDGDPAPISHTDGFVCDLCVLCSVDAAPGFDLLPEVVYDQRQTGLPQSIESAYFLRSAPQIKAEPGAPRAPPTL